MCFGWISINFWEILNYFKFYYQKFTKWCGKECYWSLVTLSQDNKWLFKLLLSDTTIRKTYNKICDISRINQFFEPLKKWRKIVDVIELLYAPYHWAKSKKTHDALVEELRLISHLVGHKKESSLIHTLNLKINEKAILGVFATCSINTHIRWMAYNMSLILHIEET